MSTAWKFSYLLGCLSLMPSLPLAAAVTDVRINEVYARMDGPDTVEFVELHGPPGQDLAGLTVLVIEGQVSSNEGTIDRVWDLTGQTIPPDGLFVIGSATTPNVDWAAVTSIEDGTETFLLVQGFTGASGNDVDADDDGVADATDTDIGTIIDSVGLAGPAASNGPTYYGAPARGPLEGTGYFPAGVARKSDGTPANDTDLGNDWCFISEYTVHKSLYKKHLCKTLGQS